MTRIELTTFSSDQITELHQKPIPKKDGMSTVTSQKPLAKPSAFEKAFEKFYISLRQPTPSSFIWASLVIGIILIIGFVIFGAIAASSCHCSFTPLG